jgi:hypothetical protein
MIPRRYVTPDSPKKLPAVASNTKSVEKNNHENRAPESAVKGGLALGNYWRLAGKDKFGRI